MQSFWRLKKVCQTDYKLPVLDIWNQFQDYLEHQLPLYSYTVSILTHFYSNEYRGNIFSGFFYENMDVKTTKEAYLVHKDQYQIYYFFLFD